MLEIVPTSLRAHTAPFLGARPFVRPRVLQGSPKMEFHPVADLFPLMVGEEFDRLCADILANGLLEPIRTHEGRIIDGRNRFNACSKVGVEPRFEEWDGDGDLVAFGVSLNLNRRHLSESQRALVAARVANVDHSGETIEAASIEAAIPQRKAAQMLNVSRASIQRAAKVLKDGVSDLEEMVESGAVTVNRAAKIAEMSKGKQKRLIKSGRAAGKKLLTKLKTESVSQMMRSGSNCLGCDPHAAFSAETVSAFMQLLASKSPAYARYFEDVVEELELEKISDSTRTNYERIFAAIDSGSCEKTDLLRATGMNRDEFSHAIAVMLDYGMIEAFQQGGKTEVARGAQKTIYRRAAVESEPVKELEYEFVDEVF